MPAGQWEPFRRSAELGDKADRNPGFGWKRDDSDSPDLDPAGDRVGRARQQVIAGAPDAGVIVADQARAAVDQAQRQVGLAASRRAGDQHAAAADRHAGRVNRRAHGAGSGKRMTKRAPERPSRLSSTAIVPSWPSIVARAMARPSPLWRPNPSLSGRRLWKRRNISLRAASGTPGPSSSMPITTSPSRRAAAISTRPPAGEKEIALSMRLSIARASRPSSPGAIVLPARGRAQAIRTLPARGSHE